METALRGFMYVSNKTQNGVTVVSINCHSMNGRSMNYRFGELSFR